MKSFFCLLLISCTAFVTQIRAADFADTFCKNPSTYLCDEKLNPSVSSISKAFQEFKQIENMAINDPSVVGFHNDGKICGKFEYGRKEWTECKSQIENMMAPKIYTKDRTEAARQIFLQAKKDLQSFLTQYSSRNSQSAMEAKVLEEMISTLDKITLKLGNQTTPFFNLSGWNAFYQSISVEKKMHLEGTVLLADNAPDTLYAIVLHELGHAISPVGDFYFPNYIGSPFLSQISCLKNEKSIGAKSTDIECVEKYRKDEGKNDPILSDIINRAKKNPDNSYFVPPSCQNGQLNEAFADLIASEVYWLKKKNTISNLTEVPNRSTGELLPSKEILQIFNGVLLFCTSIKKQNGETRQERKDPHPLASERMDYILLAHPLSMKLLGCSDKLMISNDGNIAADLIPNNGKLYCGSNMD